MFITLGLIGCASVPSVPSHDSTTPEASGAKVVLLDEGLRDMLAVDKVRSGLSGNKLLVVEADLRNRTGRDLEVQVQTLYRDENGNPLYYQNGNETAWTSFVISASSTTPYRSQALSPLAKQFTIRIRLLHRPE